jgi:hypothetical protein
LKPIDVCYGMIKAGIGFVMAIALLGSVGPTVAATGEYLIGPRQLSCRDYTVRIPLQWKAKLKKCDGEILIERRSGLLFDSESGQGLMFIHSLRIRSTAPGQAESEFRGAYSGQIAVPMQVSSVFSRCLRVDMEPNGTWISVECIDASSRIQFDFAGPEKRLNEAVALIEIKPGTPGS